MSSVFFCYRRCLIFVFCSESYNIAAARAVDREFNYIFGSDLGYGRLRPPAPPRFLGGSAPRTAQKALRALGCSGWSLFRDRATCPGQLRCLGQNIFSEI